MLSGTPCKEMRMERALAVVEAKEATKDLVREAGKLTAGVGADLILLHVTTEAEFQERQESAGALPDVGAEYGVGSALEGAERFAREVGEEVLDDQPFTAIGRLGNPQDEILDVARQEDVDHLFIHGRQRSPAGKAMFGDLAQAIILNFDGPVTVTTGDS